MLTMKIIRESLTLLLLAVVFCACQSNSKLTREQVLEARKNFKVEVLSFDASQRYGASAPFSDYVRLKITNNSKVTLPFLTVLTKRFDAAGKMIASSRAPSIPTKDIKPGDSVEYDYYPVGHIDAEIAKTAKIEVEIEQVISDEEAQFFKEFQ